MRNAGRINVLQTVLLGMFLNREDIVITDIIDMSNDPGEQPN